MNETTQLRLTEIESELRRQSLNDHDLLIRLNTRLDMLWEMTEGLPLRLVAVESEIGAIRRNAQRTAAIAGTVLAALVSAAVNFGKKLFGD